MQGLLLGVFVLPGHTLGVYVILESIQVALPNNKRLPHIDIVIGNISNTGNIGYRFL
ncbi:hypothetical protein Hsw_PB0006 (plasmid) [Hymenobacter swuensis DY53]|uniref:Uncharacterized protein n=1 Tax=Hymenobacter swuensis DY53 TaxID=1227739 RepID=W8EY42_9BACT|nr:hypothetical protein Hsw_PB0006 [Hymenobacter swuensis DY53]